MIVEIVKKGHLERGKRVKRTIKGIRFDLGLNQQEMADKLNIKLETFKAIETGRTKLPASVLVNLLDMAKINDYHDIYFKK